jgi:hypothetical protein
MRPAPNIRKPLCTHTQHTAACGIPTPTLGTHHPPHTRRRSHRHIPCALRGGVCRDGAVRPAVTTLRALTTLQRGTCCPDDAAVRHTLLCFSAQLGRGTATFDGMAIAHAVLTDLTGRLGCRALFATHYHALTREYEVPNDKVALYHMACAVDDASRAVTFLYTFAKVRALEGAGEGGRRLRVVDGGGRSVVMEKGVSVGVGEGRRMDVGASRADGDVRSDARASSLVRFRLVRIPGGSWSHTHFHHSQRAFSPADSLWLSPLTS